MDERPLHCDLFSGIGGFALAAQWAGFRTVQFCEIDPFCQKVLAKNFPGVPIHDDIKTLAGESVGRVDVITGGFPCQPVSHAGKRRGAADDRYLWPEMARLVSELRPRWVLGENVAGLISMGLDQCLSDLEDLGYEVRAVVVPACAVGAPHRRDRVWIVAHCQRERWDGQSHIATRNNGNGHHSGQEEATRRTEQRSPTYANATAMLGRTVLGDEPDGTLPGDGSPAADAARQLPHGSRDAGQGRRFEGSNRRPVAPHADESGRGPGVEYVLPGTGKPDAPWRGWWDVEPPVGRVAHGVPRRVDRLRSLGNAIVPQVAYTFLKEML